MTPVKSAPNGRTAMTGLLSGYQRSWLRVDALAGVTTAAVVIPKSMAFATIAGLTVEAELYVALVPMLVYALLESSRPSSVSSTSTLAMLTGKSNRRRPQQLRRAVASTGQGRPDFEKSRRHNPGTRNLNWAHSRQGLRIHRTCSWAAVVGTVVSLSRPMLHVDSEWQRCGD
jgi:Sulfate permease family